MNSRAKTTSAAPPSSTPTSAGTMPSTQRSTRMIDREGFAVGCDDTPIFYRVHGPAERARRRLLRRHRLRRLRLEVPRGRARRPPTASSTGTIAATAARRCRAIRGASTSPISPTISRRCSTPPSATVASAVLAGHSMGVQVCLETYRRHASRVRGPHPHVRQLRHAAAHLQGQAHARAGAAARALRGQSASRASRSTMVARLMPTELAYQIATRFEINGELIRRDDFFPYLEHMARVDVRLFLEMLAAAGRHTRARAARPHRRADADRLRRSRRLHAGAPVGGDASAHPRLRAARGRRAARTRRPSSGRPRSPSASPISCARSLDVDFRHGSLLMLEHDEELICGVFVTAVAAMPLRARRPTGDDLQAKRPRAAAARQGRCSKGEDARGRARSHRQVRPARPGADENGRAAYDERSRQRRKRDRR